MTFIYRSLARRMGCPQSRSKRWKMRNPLATLACMIVVLGLSSPAWAEPKTVKACQEEWRANKADNQAKGITEKAYVTQCRAGAASAQPASTPAPAPSAVAPAPVKTAKACRDEWQANKAGYQAAKITEKAYIDKCRAGEAVALPNTPAAAPTPAAPAPTAAAPAPAPTQAAPPPAPARQAFSDSCDAAGGRRSVPD